VVGLGYFGSDARIAAFLARMVRPRSPLSGSIYSGGNWPALNKPSVRQWPANAAFLHNAQRRRSVVRANRASHPSGCPGQFGFEGQASGTFRSCQRDLSLSLLRSKITSRSRSTGCSAGKRTPLIWCAAQRGIRRFGEVRRGLTIFWRFQHCRFAAAAG
jgi:hypothetical protein